MSVKCFEALCVPDLTVIANKANLKKKYIHLSFVECGLGSYSAKTACTFYDLQNCHMVCHFDILLLNFDHLEYVK